MPSPSFATSLWYMANNGNCNWDEPSNWYYSSGGTKNYNSAPTSSDVVSLGGETIALPNYLTITSGVNAVASSVSFSSAARTIGLKMIGDSTLTVGTDVVIGNSGPGEMLMLGGPTLSVGNKLTVGYGSSSGELVMSNATVRLTNSTLNWYLFIGSSETAHGVLRGWGTVVGGTNNARFSIRYGSVVGDGFGEDRILVMDSLASVQNAGEVSRDTTNGWYAVNCGAAQFPRAWFYLSDKSEVLTGCCGDKNEPTLPTNLVNGVGFSLSGFSSVGARYFRAGIYAEDRSDVHADTFPRNNGILGIWKTRFDDGKGYFCGVSYISLWFRFDHTKVKSCDRLVLYRWENSKWTKVAEGTDAGDHLISVSGLSSLSEEWNIGTYLLVKAKRGLCVIVK
ncbi:MAG: hypothetical protein IJI54_08990 [Kiritimatiellae bacterium]|nr:hypothetical protein [Kiritimatiellia bacterium]